MKNNVDLRGNIFINSSKGNKFYSDTGLNKNQIKKIINSAKQLVKKCETRVAKVDKLETAFIKFLKSDKKKKPTQDQQVAKKKSTQTKQADKDRSDFDNQLEKLFSKHKKKINAH